MTFNDDIVDIPRNALRKFTRYGNCLIGKQHLQFTAACGTGKEILKSTVWRS